MTRPITNEAIYARIDELAKGVLELTDEFRRQPPAVVRPPFFNETRRDILRRFTSRRFLLATFGPVIIAAANWLNVPTEFVIGMVTLMVAFVLGESYVDKEAAKKGHQPAPAPAASPAHLEAGERTT